ncbi:ABC transporter permease [Leptospira idonii]|uniref:Transport permease protein n=1 Tax=Leptospira idonii TaxID=1193500 RepID=A0A4R9LVL6_9LEPT|nr:ABC transporter permease [Leptospira idonii]TGN18293.1 ABC transporter permease [Leptospira idonii]
MSNKLESESFSLIDSKTRIFHLNLSELWQYKDLIYYFVKRDFVSFYKQTILGPLWYLVQPIVSSVVLFVVFTKIAKLPTGTVPPFLFYLSGNILWMYFAENLNRTSDTFIVNSSIFGKVYFPRLTVPISTTLSGLISFFIQYALFLSVYAYYYFQNQVPFFTVWIFLTPFAVLYLALISFSFGIMISSLTTKYRDLRFILRFGIQLWMFASPIAYSIQQVPKHYLSIYMLNPITPVIEGFRFIYFQNTLLTLDDLLCNFIINGTVLVLSILLFNRVEKSFMDTV